MYITDAIKVILGGNSLDVTIEGLLESWKPSQHEMNAIRRWLDRDHRPSRVLYPLLADDGYLLRLGVTTSSSDVKAIATTLSKHGFKLTRQSEKDIENYLSKFPERSYNRFLERGAAVGQLYKIVKAD
jgi:hypothetical protein